MFKVIAIKTPEQGSNQKGKVHSQKIGIAKCGEGATCNARKRQAGFWGSELKHAKKYELTETYVNKIISNLKKHNHKATY